MSIDPRTPVVVATGQAIARVDAGEAYREPLLLMADAARAAAAAAGADRLLRSIDAVRVCNTVSGAYRNLPALLADELGVPARQHALVLGGGETPVAMLADAAGDILAGRLDAVLLTSGEAWWSHTRAERDGRTIERRESPDALGDATVVGSRIEFVHPHEAQRGVVRPIQQYPLFEQALRVHHGRTLEEHQAFLGALWARFSDVACDNPYAWDRTRHDATEIATASPTNRYVGFPYTKLLVSNEQVDLAAAIVVCSAAHADAMGVPRDRWVFPVAAARGAAWAVSERPELWRSVLAEAVGARVAALWGRALDEVDHVDLYSCFPSAVQQQAAGLGLRIDRPLTVTGGMRFAGGPWSGYAMHGLAAMADRLHHHPGHALCSGNGGAVTKLAVMVLANEPPTVPFRIESAQDELDRSPRLALDEAPDGDAVVESCTVMHDRTGAPTRSILLTRRPDGRRAWGLTDDPDVGAHLVHHDVIGTTVHLRPDGAATFG